MLTLSWTVTNTVAATGAGVTSHWTDAIIASPDATLGNSGDVVVATFDHDGLLNIGETYSRTGTFRLPPAFTGRYHLFVLTDSNHVVFENGIEANNAAEISPFDVKAAASH